MNATALARDLGDGVKKLKKLQPAGAGALGNVVSLHAMDGARPARGPAHAPAAGRVLPRDVDCWPSQLWSIWDAQVRAIMQRRSMPAGEAQWAAYAQILRGRVPLPPLTVHQLPGGGFPRWAERLPAEITWVYTQPR